MLALCVPCSSVIMPDRLVVMLEPLPLKPNAAFLEDSSLPGATLGRTSKRLLRPRAQVVQQEKSTDWMDAGRTEAVLASGPHRGGAGEQQEDPCRSGGAETRGETAGPVQAHVGSESSPGLQQASMRQAGGGRQARTGKSGVRAKARRVQGRGSGLAASCAGGASSKTGPQAVAERPKAGREPTEGGSALMAEGPGLLLGTGSASSSKKRRGDEEFELQIALAVAATAPPASEGPPEAAPPGFQSVGGASSKSRRVSGSSLRSSAAVWSQDFGSISHWAEVYCRESRKRCQEAAAWARAAPLPAEVSGAAGPDATGGRWVHWDAARGVVDGAGKVEGLVAGQGQGLRYVVACAGGGAKDVTKRYAALWSRVAPLRDEDWWQATLAPLVRLEAEAGTREPGSTGPGMDAPQLSVHTSALASPGSKSGGVPTQRHSSGDDAVHLQPELAPALARSLSGNTGLPGEEGGEERVEPERDTPVAKPASRSLERGSLEDMELEIKALTEPLPSSQQAYRTHPLYALERWLGKYQALHPRGPVLGLCAGQPVFPRACVKQLHTRRRWLAEGRSVKEGERCFKVVKERRRGKRGATEGCMETQLGAEETRGHARATEGTPPCRGERRGGGRIGQGDSSVGDGGGGELENGDRGLDGPEADNRFLELFGEWQTEAFVPAMAENGRVPKNQWGQVDVWSEAMLPRGTVHLRYPGISSVAHRLGFDFAPAMVGFEMRDGRPMPKLEGVVVCVEHAEAILDAFLEEERAKEEARLRRRRHAATLRWRDLLQALLLRQELKDKYERKVCKAPPEQLASNTFLGKGQGKTTGDRLQSPSGQASPAGQGILAAGSMETSGDRSADTRPSGAINACINGHKENMSFLEAGGLDSGTPGEEGSMDALRSSVPTSDVMLQVRGNATGDDHVHEFLDREGECTSGLRTRVCKCGFQIEVEEM